MLLQKVLIAGSVTQQFQTVGNFPMDDEWRVSECDQLWVTEDAVCVASLFILQLNPMVWKSNGPTISL